MTEIKFLQTSDWQIGMTRWFLSDEAQARFDDARLTAITRLGEIAVEQDCAFIVVAGDVFESNALNKRTTGRVREVLAALPVPVYLLPGNHDPLTPDSIFFSDVAVPEGVHVLADSTPVEVVPGVELVGAPLRSKHSYDDLVRQALEPLEPCAPGKIRIAVAHGQALSRSSEPAPDTIDLDYVEDCLDRGVIDYLALGDTHSAQPVGNSGKVWFSGAPEVTDYADLDTAGGESNSGKALVVSIAGGQVRVTEHPVGKWQFHTFRSEVNSRAEAEEFVDRLKSYANKAEVCVKYALRGDVDVETMQYVEAEIAQLEPIFAALYPRDRLMDFHLSPDQSDLDALELSGYQLAALQELLAPAENGHDAQTADDALKLMFRLSGERR
ncbi:metallophosphoesterase family protein [Corynebacterium epidermidicanis]|uniref:Nuclease SbcCD subunit D n=1 Tax=Corynebacterium epidermidicanis TaxID=1050174 RepID=A0A0G3GVH1_9CORY|nr:DNA repair exonuclease [Corynebacterium epidermidicanis]AKK02857.1 DNA repair exonuclease [Corynebacterium epidermidicanis]